MPGIDINFFIRQANKLTEKIEKRKAELANDVVTGAAAEMITVTANGVQEVKSIKIDKKALDANDPAMLEDMLVAAVNQALANSRELMRKELEKVSNGVKIPGVS
jgi:DNA-binding YbaB/EbfC family protein